MCFAQRFPFDVDKEKVLSPKRIQKTFEFTQHNYKVRHFVSKIFMNITQGKDMAIASKQTELALVRVLLVSLIDYRTLKIILESLLPVESHFKTGSLSKI